MPLSGAMSEPDASGSQTVVCILGMHRSGTSALAGSLECHGLYLGDVIRWALHNPRGNNELEAVRTLHDDVLRDSGGSWNAPPPRVVWKPERKEALHRIVESFSGRPIWGFKDPRTLLTFEGWLEELPDMKFVGTFRHPRAVVDSIVARQPHYDEAGAVDLWCRYNQTLLDILRNTGAGVVCFDRPEQAFLDRVTQMARVLGLSEDVDGETFYDPELRHWQRDDWAGLPPAAKHLYEDLLALDRAPRVSSGRPYTPTRPAPPLVSPPASKPALSVIVMMYNMRREAPRTLASLAPGYQRHCSAHDYEVIVVDNGSSEPLSPDVVTGFGPNFSYLYHDTDSVSPAGAANAAIAAAKGDAVTICIDGARIVSPGVVASTLAAIRAYDKPVVATLSWHLGDEPQADAMLKGYDQGVEDALLGSVDWEADGYRLFEISCLAISSGGGWFLPFSESNCLTMSREMLDTLGGLDERFVTKGGGLVNLDLFKRACELPGSQVVVLLGEGSFHQFHGGVATNTPRSRSPVRGFMEEYEAIRGEVWHDPQIDPVFLGTMPSAALPTLELSAIRAGEVRGTASPSVAAKAKPASARDVTNRAVVVLGMHRSGTSALTRIVSLLGAGLPGNLMPETDDNPHGYWESWDLSRLNNALFATAGTAWHHDSSIPIEWFGSGEARQLRPRARAFVQQAFRENDLLVLKDPRLCRLLPFWRSVLEELDVGVSYLLIARHPDEVFWSLEARNAMKLQGFSSSDKAHLLWLRYVLEAEQHTRGTARSILTYDGLLDDWEATVRRAASEASLPLPVAIANAAGDIDEFLRPEHKRHSVTPASAAHGSLATDVYELLADHADGGAPLDQRRLDEARGALDAAEEYLAPLRTLDRSDQPTDSPWDQDMLEQATSVALRAAEPTPRVLFVSEEPTSRGHTYRVSNHVAALKAVGVDAWWEPVTDRVLTRADLADAVVVFRSRWNPTLERLYDRCRQHGTPVGFDIDDLVFDPEIATPANLHFHPPNAERRWIEQHVEGYRRSLVEADYAIVPTEPLADAVGRFDKPALVLPNGVDPGMLAAAEAALLEKRETADSVDGPVRLGYASGTATHQYDFAFIAETIAELFSERPDVRLTVVGRLEIEEFEVLLPHRGRIDIRPFVPHADLFSEYARFDVNLAPLEPDNPFCEGKSQHKFFEAALVETPTVASATQPFRSVIEPGVHGWLASSADDWRDALLSLVDSPAERQRLGRAARTHALAVFGPRAQSEDARRTIMSIPDLGRSVIAQEAPAERRAVPPRTVVSSAVESN